MEKFSTLVNDVTRPLVTTILVAVLAYGFVSRFVGADQFLPVVTMVIGFWFGQRTSEKTQNAIADAAARVARRGGS